MVLEKCIPQFTVVVWGDWESVIRVRNYRDSLLNQKPDCEDDARYNEYRIQCNSAEEIATAVLAFAAEDLDVAIQVAIVDVNRGRQVAFASSYDGWSNGAPYAFMGEMK